MSKRASSDPKQAVFSIFTEVEIIPNGLGAFTLSPKKPELEIGTRKAAKMLGISRSQMNALADDAVAMRILRWRWTTPRQGKRLWDSQSVAAYKEATRDPEFGGRT